MRLIWLAVAMMPIACVDGRSGSPTPPGADAEAPADTGPEDWVQPIPPPFDGSVVEDGGKGDGGTNPPADASAEDADVADSGPGPTDPCIDDVTPGLHLVSCDGLSYRVSVPQACANPECGLILDVHGLSMSGAMQEANTNLAALAMDRDFVIIQPSATPRPPLASWAASDDAAVFDFLSRAKVMFAIDPGRVHFTGFSQGGFMTWRMICNHADVLASAAPGAAGEPCSNVPACDFVSSLPSREIDIIYLHGTTDALVDFSCGTDHVAAVRTAWALDTETTVASGPDFAHLRYENTNGTVLEFVRHDWSSSASRPLVPDIVGHCFPGSTDPGNEPGQLYSFACDPPNAIHWGETVLDFFDTHRN